MQLLSVCFRPMMMAICTNRSIMQPLRWHCGGKGGRSGTGPGADQGVGAVQEEGSKASGQTDLLQLPQPCQAHGLPGVTIDPGKGREAERGGRTGVGVGEQWGLEGKEGDPPRR